jgi:hypothetical protein
VIKGLRYVRAGGGAESVRCSEQPGCQDWMARSRRVFTEMA